jgi:2-keto-4-pentenoate hydratase
MEYMTVQQNSEMVKASSDVANAASALFDARTQGYQIAPLRESFGLSEVSQAYEIQRLNTERWRARGRRTTGCKIGLTSKAVQEQLGVSEPDFGVLWSDLAFGPGAVLPAGRFLQPKAEAEIAFILGRDLVASDLSMPDILSAVDYVLPAVEIVDSAIDKWNIRLVDTIADNASSGGYVLGDSPRLLSQVDLRTCGMLLTRAGELVSQGVGAACLGHPLNAVLWLARKMVEMGAPMKAGDLVLSGALGPMVPCGRGDRFQVEIQGFAPFSFSFSQ